MDARENKKPFLQIQKGFSLVGVAGFEPTTSTSQMWRDTGLRYTPKRYHLCGIRAFSGSP